VKSPADYTNPTTNPRTFTTLTLTLADTHDPFESFCAQVFCDYGTTSESELGPLVTSFTKICLQSRLVHAWGNRNFNEADD